MNNDIILKAENISKQYRLGLVGTGTLSHDLNRWWHKVRGKEDPFLKVGEVNDRSTKGQSDYVWALKDITFEIKRGEVLGIIGKNGAGKSTLLKILSRVTSPTTGEIKTKGRIASLLEVGTGFHPEMTGRENIFLNGAILGMTKAEISSKIDEIIDFSGCQRYIDTPVKRYSSGMTVRLAFSVAAYLEPDILIIDEVLAVGDAEFQKKAIGKMQDISKGEGRTVLFVSHDMAAIKSLCNRTILLENGRLSVEGDTQFIIDSYLSNNIEGDHIKDFSNGLGIIKKVNFVKTENQEIVSGGSLVFLIEIDTNKLEYLTVGYVIKDDLQKNIHAANMQQYNKKIKVIKKKNTVEVKIESLPLVPGKYTISIYVGNGSFDEEIIYDVLRFTVYWDDTLKHIKPKRKWGIVYAPTMWNYY